MSHEIESTNLVGKYTIKDFSNNRQMLHEIYDEFLKKHYMTGYFEVNVSPARQMIKEYELIKGEKISFTGWIAKCVSDSIQKYPEINSYRWKKNKLIQFDDIDIIVMVERQLADKIIAVPHSVRQSQTKDLLTISREIRSAQKVQVSEREQLLDQSWKVKVYKFIPKLIRKRIMSKMMKDPFYIKRQGGLVIITAVGMFTNTRLWVGGFGGITTLNIALGGIIKRLVKQNENIIEQEYLQITAFADHDIIDGGPATRFQSHLVHLIESGNGLQQLIQNNTN